MGREVRMVPQGWEHPRNEDGEFIPLFEGTYSADLAEWEEEKRQWKAGYRRDYSAEGVAWKSNIDVARNYTLEIWCGARPDPANYMPEFDPGTATHLMMYETCSEGTPISPAFATPEELARWLADNNASAFGDMTASYEAWLATCKRGWAPSAVLSSGVLRSGVDEFGMLHASDCAVHNAPAYDPDPCDCAPTSPAK